MGFVIDLQSRKKLEGINKNCVFRLLSCKLGVGLPFNLQGRNIDRCY